MSDSGLLVVDGLTVHIRMDDGLVVPVRDVSFTVRSGLTLALVGESGSGKSMTAYAIMDLLPPSGFVAAGRINLQGQDLLSLKRKEMRQLCGNRLAMIFQEPMTALHPAFTIGWQLTEVLLKDKKISRPEARKVALDKLRLVEIPEPEQRFDQYIHELSGGMRQRVMIAMALMSNPDLLIADEPTTGLDVTIQSQILNLLKDLQQRLNLGIILITHDMGVVAQNADHVCVMREGEILEQAAVRQLFAHPQHRYTQDLLKAVPVLGQAKVSQQVVRATSEPLLAVADLCVHFPVQTGIFRRSEHVVHAVDDLTLQIEPGQTLGLVGESGCGKSTFGRTMIGLINPTAGEVRFQGKALQNFQRTEWLALRQGTALIYQDPYSSLDPRMMVAEIIAEPLVVHRIGTTRSRRQTVEELLERVYLGRSMASRFPHELSGGQRQRVGIARALALRPKLIVCDEPTSALDVTIQAEVIALLKELQQQDNLALLFISHDLAVVEVIASRIVVMYLGRMVEFGSTEQVIRDPRHPYTQILIAASPVPDPSSGSGQVNLIGDPPSPIHPPSGCPFHPRCVLAKQECAAKLPDLRQVGGGRFIACEVVAV